MEASTFDGVPIIKRPQINDWKKFKAIVVKKQVHGDLLMGPGLQFLYSPYEGYIGEDTFTYSFIDNNGRVLGEIVVKVTVKPIPVLDVPQEGRL